MVALPLEVAAVALLEAAAAAQWEATTAGPLEVVAASREATAAWPPGVVAATQLEEAVASLMVAEVALLMVVETAPHSAAAEVAAEAGPLVEALPEESTELRPSLKVGVMLQLEITSQQWTRAIGLNGNWLKFALDWRSLHHGRSHCPLRQRRG